MTKLLRTTAFIIALLIILVLTQGCALKKANTNLVTTPCNGSVILSILDNAKDIGTLIEVMNFTAMAKNKYTKEQARGAITIVREFLERDDVTFGELIELTKPMLYTLSMEADTEMDSMLNTGGNILRLSEIFVSFEVTWLMNDCDKKILIGLCDRLLAQCE